MGGDDDGAGLAGWRPARLPEPMTLTGARVRLEPLDAERHGADLFAASHGPSADQQLWRHLPYGPFATAEAFGAWVAGWAGSRDPLFFAIVDVATDTARGMASLLRVVPEHGSVEIGHVWFGTGLQRTAMATEALALLMGHGFALGNRRLEWKCDAANARSRRAAQRLGFAFEGIFRQHMVVKGRNRDSAWFSLLDGEWPAVRTAFEAWLAPENLAADGRQRRSLEQLRRRP